MFDTIFVERLWGRVKVEEVYRHDDQTVREAREGLGSTSPFTAVTVLAKEKNVRFIAAGAGDHLYGAIDLAASLGIGHRAFFTRFLRRADVDKAYRMNA